MKQFKKKKKYRSAFLFRTMRKMYFCKYFWDSFGFRFQNWKIGGTLLLEFSTKRANEKLPFFLLGQGLMINVTDSLYKRKPKKKIFVQLARLIRLGFSNECFSFSHVMFGHQISIIVLQIAIRIFIFVSNYVGL